MGGGMGIRPLAMGHDRTKGRSPCPHQLGNLLPICKIRGTGLRPSSVYSLQQITPLFFGATA